MMNQPTNTLYNATIASPIASNVVISISYLLLSNNLNLTYPTDNFCHLGRVSLIIFCDVHHTTYPQPIHRPVDNVIHMWITCGKRARPRSRACRN
jgi:hypothetical protein